MSIKTTNNVLDRDQYKLIRNNARGRGYLAMSRNCVFLADCKRHLSEPLNETIRDQLGEFKMIANYFRYYSRDVDSKTRIHTDTAILGHKPTHGVVFGIDVGEGTGTSFWTHKEYGDTLPDGIVQEEKEYSDDSLWEYKQTVPVPNNTMISYPSDMFHQKYPTVQTKERFVWVAFVKQL